MAGGLERSGAEIFDQASRAFPTVLAYDRIAIEAHAGGENGRENRGKRIRCRGDLLNCADLEKALAQENSETLRIYWLDLQPCTKTIREKTDAP